MAAPQKPLLWQPEERRVGGKLERIWPFRLHLTDDEMAAIRRRAKREGVSEAVLVQSIFRAAMNNRLNFTPQKLACGPDDAPSIVPNGQGAHPAVAVNSFSTAREDHPAWGVILPIWSNFPEGSVRRRFLDELLICREGVTSVRLRAILDTTSTGYTVGNIIASLRSRLLEVGCELVNGARSGGNAPSGVYTLRVREGVER
ncbi:MAG: hypothetical protein AAF737_04890 [Pseudomonadota bacterium]